jgi:hypothetical protein
MWKAVALLSLLLVQPLRAQEMLQWAQIEQVEVKARPGPAVWHLTRGDSEVWLLGTVGVMPKEMDWNKEYLSELLEGSRAILMPPKADVGLVDIAWFLLMHGGELSLPRGQIWRRASIRPCAPVSSPPAMPSAMTQAITPPTFPSAPPSGCSRT